MPVPNSIPQKIVDTLEQNYMPYVYADCIFLVRSRVQHSRLKTFQRNHGGESLLKFDSSRAEAVGTQLSGAVPVPSGDDREHRNHRHLIQRHRHVPSGP